MQRARAAAAGPLMSEGSRRMAVRQLYKRVMKLGTSWEARNTANTARERAYIVDEARALFRQHMHESDPAVVEQLLQEGQGRVDIAEHYHIPYQRTSNLPPGVSAYDYQSGSMSSRQAPRYSNQSHPLFDD